MAVQPWRTGKVIRIEHETNATTRFWIQIPELESFDFKPGQFVTLDLPIHEKLYEYWALFDSTLKFSAAFSKALFLPFPEIRSFLSSINAWIGSLI